MDEQPRHDDERDQVTVALVGPDARLLFLLVVLLVGAALVAVFVVGGDDGEEGRVGLGSLADLAQQTEAGPVRLAELPHLVVARAPTRAPVYDAQWGQSTGAVLLTPFEQLVVLETRDPEDDAELTWCRSANAFVHPDRLRWYGADGTLLAGDGRRGMDRRALSVVGGGALEVDDGRWVQGLPLRATDTAWSPRGNCD